MKKIFFALTVLATIVSCTDKTHYVVNGTISETDLTKGAIVVMTDMSDRSIMDTAQIVEGKFTFKGNASDTTMKRIALVTENKMRNMNYCTIIPEGGVINVNLDSTDMVSGTPLNEALSKMNSEIGAIYAAYQEKYTELSKIYQGVELREALSSFGDSLTTVMDSINDNAYQANKTNAIGLSIAQGKAGSFETLADYDAFFADAADFVKNDARVVSARKTLEAQENTSAGKMFADFKGTDKNNNEISLSSYVGKGKYVLVDFWASWCGPCRGEIPNLVNIDKLYRSKGIVVLGVPVWDKREETDKAIAELGIKYDQIYVGDDKTPTDIYGIPGIPQIILFAPDGTIAKRDLRGETIEEAVKEALAK